MRAGFLVTATCVAAAALALSACGTGGYVDSGSQGNGRQLFLDSTCDDCHALADAGSRGTIGPDLDDAFAQARADGMTSDTFTQVVAQQIKYPIEQTSTGKPGMPGPEQTLPLCDDVEQGAFCVNDRERAINDIAVYVGAVAGTGRPPPEQPPEGDGEVADGKSIFTANCGSCHTLADAGTSGTVGPNLDQSRPSKELAVDRVTNGMGAMPSFSDTLDQQQIEAVAEYVSSSAGG